MFSPFRGPVAQKTSQRALYAERRMQDILIVERGDGQKGRRRAPSPRPTIDYLASEHRKSLPGLAPVALPFSKVTSPLHMIQR
jgi:hypothetical protein